MKTYKLLCLGFASFCLTAWGQVFAYDQQSSVEGVYGEGGGVIQPNQPMGQSFTPEFSGVGFIRLYIIDTTGLGGLGGTIYVNILGNSITGTVLGKSDIESIPTGGFTGPVNFFFQTSVAVTPGVAYYFQPVANNNTLAVAGDNGGSYYSYPGGTAFFNGVSQPNEDLWFREGIYIVPEPSPLWLILLGGGIWFFVRRRHKDFKLV